ncbi:MAG: hypothetical protein QOH68_863 [Nocardioidaceae bacterium]|jgi:SDR family mycofactocin-dependent oxidoreductase|nr:hypothetical protein [Nocardioidaceae bacterium]
MAGKLEGKVVFITGVARGQGRTHAVRFAEEGAAVIGVDLCEDLDAVEYPLATPDDLVVTVAAVEKVGGRIHARKADVRNRDEMEQVLQEGIAQFGRLDYVLANAGVMPIWGTKAGTMDAWHTCLDIMLTGVLNTIEISYPTIRDHGDGGSIVITSSMAALKPMMRTENALTVGMLGYASAKAGLISLARNYASVLGPYGIRVNTVHPSGVDTPMINNELTRGYFETATEQDKLVLVPALPVSRLEPEDVSSAALWLCSEESKFFTGSVMRLDGGASLR